MKENIIDVCLVFPPYLLHRIYFYIIGENR